MPPRQCRGAAAWAGWTIDRPIKRRQGHGDATLFIICRVNSAVVAAIAPICVDQFQRSADAANNLRELQKANAWEQATYIEEGGSAMMPGSKAVDSGVPQACAAMLSNLK